MKVQIILKKDIPPKPLSVKVGDIIKFISDEGVMFTTLLIVHDRATGYCGLNLDTYKTTTTKFTSPKELYLHFRNKANFKYYSKDEWDIMLTLEEK